ncbi:MAG: integrase core domain-containing protein [Methylocella sp.]
MPSNGGRLRDESLNETLFSSIVQPRVILTEWRADANANREHSRIGSMTSLACAASLVPATGRAGAQPGSFAPRPVAHPAQMGATQRRILPIAG